MSSLVEVQSQIPIVGLPLKAHEGHVMVTLTCLCYQDNPPLLIRGVDMAAVCTRCQNIYAILEVKFSRGAGDKVVNVLVGQVGKKPLETQK